jgi:hypothetical protein
VKTRRGTSCISRSPTNREKIRRLDHGARLEAGELHVKRDPETRCPVGSGIPPPRTKDDSSCAPASDGPCVETGPSGGRLFSVQCWPLTPSAFYLRHGLTDAIVRCRHSHEHAWPRGRPHPAGGASRRPRHVCERLPLLFDALSSPRADDERECLPGVWPRGGHDQA